MAAEPQKKQLRKGDKFFCTGCNRPNATYESGGLCGVCNAKARKVKRAAASAALPAGPVKKARVVYSELDQDIKEHQPNFTCPACGKRYYAQGCNECPFCGVDHVEILPDSKNADGEDAEFSATDPLLLELIDRMMLSVERRLLVDVAGMPFDLAAIHVIKTVEGMARRGV